MWKILYHPLVIKEDIPKLGTSEKKRFKKAVEQKLSSDPLSFGVPLRRSLRGYLKLRVGDYRIIFRIEKNTVFIFLITHRSRAYEKIYKDSMKLDFY